MKKKVPFDTWLISGLRRLCMKWPPYYNTKNKCKHFINIIKVEEFDDNWKIYYTEEGDIEHMWAKHAPKLGKRVAYHCECCNLLFLDKDYYLYKNGKRKKRTTIVIDHVEPVCGPEGRTTWDDYIKRMFPQDKEGPFQCLCRKCHEAKSKEENDGRSTRKPKKIHKGT